MSLPVLLMAGCGLQSPWSSASVPATGTSAAGASSTGEAVVTAELPDLVGSGLQYAQDTAQAAGFAVLTSHDASGRGRSQLLDRDWKVCFQTPAQGERAVTTTVDFGVVKTGESCPVVDAGAEAVPSVTGTMPDFTGMSLQVARRALGLNASITVVDGSGRSRPVLVGSNWQVCSQEPAAGQVYAGAPVTFTVVKFSETC